MFSSTLTTRRQAGPSLREHRGPGRTPNRCARRGRTMASTSPSSWTETVAGPGSGVRPRRAGHVAGAAAVRRTVEAAPGLGITTLTLYAFSADNWRRPQGGSGPPHASVPGPPALGVRPLCRQGRQADVMGRRDRLPPGLRGAIETAESRTSSGSPPPFAHRHRLLGAGRAHDGGHDDVGKRSSLPGVVQRGAGPGHERSPGNPRRGSPDPNRRRASTERLPPLGIGLCRARLHGQGLARFFRPGPGMGGTGVLDPRSTVRRAPSVGSRPVLPITPVRGGRYYEHTRVARDRHSRRGRGNGVCRRLSPARSGTSRAQLRPPLRGTRRLGGQCRPRWRTSPEPGSRGLDGGGGPPGDGPHMEGVGADAVPRVRGGSGGLHPSGSSRRESVGSEGRCGRPPGGRNGRRVSHGPGRCTAFPDG